MKIVIMPWLWINFILYYIMFLYLL